LIHSTFGRCLYNNIEDRVPKLTPADPRLICLKTGYIDDIQNLWDMEGLACPFATGSRH
jgi:hypothetical protein